MKKVVFFKMTILFQLLFLTFIFSFQSALGQEQSADVEAGKKLFNANCAACHKLNKKAVGPALRGVTQKYEREWLYSWIKNSSAMVKAGDADAVAIFEEYNGSVMTSFPQLSNTDIDNVLAYTDYVPPKDESKVVAIEGTQNAPTNNNFNEIVLAVLALVLLLLIVALVLVQKTLLRIANASGVELKQKEHTAKVSVWEAFVKNQFLVLITVIFLLLASAYYVYGYLMQVGIDEGYMPVQPIHYSHKIHAGANQIECKYCHSSARVSKHSGIPSLNVCMNCHRNIAEYNGEEDLANGYTKEFYTKEIKKLYAAVGWDEENQRYTGENHSCEMGADSQLARLCVL